MWPINIFLQTPKKPASIRSTIISLTKPGICLIRFGPFPQYQFFTHMFCTISTDYLTSSIVLNFIWLEINIGNTFLFVDFSWSWCNFQSKAECVCERKFVYTILYDYIIYSIYANEKSRKLDFKIIKMIIKSDDYNRIKFWLSYLHAA